MPTELKFKRKSKLEIDSIPIEDGRILFSTDTPEIFMDNGSERKTYGGSSGEKVVNHGTSDITFELPSNEYHKWGEVSVLTLTLKTPEKIDIVNEYHFSFDSGETATTLSLPEDIKTDIVVQMNTHYECSIIDNYMVFNDWSVISA